MVMLKPTDFEHAKGGHRFFFRSVLYTQKINMEVCT